MSHWYSKEGELLPEGMGYPSVTTILSVRDNPGLDAWRLHVGAEEAQRRSKEATDKGTAVHAACEEYLLGKLEQGPIGLMNWLEKVKPTKCQPELFLFSDLHEYAGTADLICEIDGEPWLIDFKTSKHIDAGYALQLAAYVQAYKEMTGVECRRAVLQLTDQIQRGYRWKEFTDPDDFGVFMAHKEVHDWLVKISPKKKEKTPYEAVMT